MTVIVPLPEGYCHDHFELIVTKKLEPGALTPDDALALDNMLQGSRRLRNRLRRINTQTQQQ